MTIRLILLAGVLSVLTVQGQMNVADRAAEALNRVPRLHVMLILGNDRLLPGDTTSLLAGVYDASGNIFTRRQVLEVELVNTLGTIVHRQHILLPDGKADTYLTVPSALPSGAYMIRAYTEFMKNFGEATFFRKEIEVLSDRLQRKAPAQPEIFASAEGGNLVAGVPNRIILRYKAIPLGSTIEVVGSISGKIVRTFAAAGNVSEVMVRPAAGEEFTVRHPSITASAAPVIRTANREAVALHLEQSGSDRRLVVYIPEAAGIRRNQLTAVAVGGGVVSRLQRISGNADSVRYNVPSDLKDGLYQAIIFDEEAHELAHRCFAVNQKTINVDVQWSATVPGFRQDLEAAISIADKQGKPVKADLNVHVTDQRALLPESYAAGREWLPGLFISEDISQEDSDLLLATRADSWLPEGWNTAGYQPKWPSQSVIRFSGSVRRNNGLPLRDSTTIMLFLQNRMLGYEVDIREGRFNFPVLFDFRGNDELFYVVHRKDSLVRDIQIHFDMDTTSSVRPAPLQTQYARDPYTDYVSRRRTTDRSYRFFTSAVSRPVPEEPNPNERFERELRGTDITVRIDDYVVFPTVEDVVREIVPSLKHRRIGGRNAIRVFLYSPVITNDPILSSSDPLYIIDGQMTLSTEYFMKIDPADLISISIVRNVHKLQHFGYLGKNGVVLVRTRKPQAIRSFAENTVLPVQGFNSDWKGTSAAPQNPRVPDLRVELGRKIHVATDDNGRTGFSFRTGDMSGIWLLRVDGITNDGSPVHHIQRVEVNGKP